MNKIDKIIKEEIRKAIKENFKESKTNLLEGLPVGRSDFARRVSIILTNIVGKISPDNSRRARILAHDLIMVIDEDQDEYPDFDKANGPQTRF